MESPTFARLPEVGRNPFQYKQHLCQTTLKAEKDFTRYPPNESPRTQPHKAQNKACKQPERKRTSNIPQIHESR